MVNLTASFSDETFALMESFAREQEVNLSEVMRQKMLDWLEDQEDLRDAQAAYEEYLRNPELLVDFKELKDEWLK